MRRLIPFLLALPVQAKDAPAGFFAATDKLGLPEIVLSAGQPLGAPWALKSGTYCEVEITSDGSRELALARAGFLRAIWIDETVIEGPEIRPWPWTAWNSTRTGRWKSASSRSGRAATA